MASYLPASSIIYQLYDTELELNNVDWDKFLLNPHGRERLHRGFCAVINDATPTTTLACCEVDDQNLFEKALNVSLFCFRNFDLTTVEKLPNGVLCLTTIQVLGPRHAERCENDDECSNPSMRCVTPYTPSKNGQVLRIYASMLKWMNLTGDQDKVFVFESDLLNIRESVKVDIWQPKWWFLPATLPHRAEL